MKLVVAGLGLACLSACQSRSHEGPEPAQASSASAQATSAIDFASLQGKSMTVEEFVKACQSISGFNFTYSETTQQAMGAKSMRLDGMGQVAPADLGKFLDKQLGACGFTCARIGPDHLRVFSITPRAS